MSEPQQTLTDPSDPVQFSSPSSVRAENRIYSPAEKPSPNSNFQSNQQPSIKMDLPTRFVLMSSEIERLTLLNTKHIQESEMWKAKALGSTRNSPNTSKFVI
jgi:hypothetical protein